MGEEKNKKNNWNTIWQECILSWDRVILVGEVLLTVLAFSMNYEIVGQEVAENNFEKIYSQLPSISVFLRSIDAQPLKTFVLLCFLIKLYRSSIDNKISRRKRFAVGILSLIASVSLLVGNAIYKYDGLEILFLGGIQCTKSFIVLGGYYLFFRNLFTIMVNAYEKNLINKKNSFKIGFFDRKYAGIIVFTALLILWGMVLFIYYPAIFMGDTEDIVYMAFNYPTFLTKTVVLPKEGVYLTNHHPVMYTAFIGFMMKTFKAWGSNGAIFACAIVQCIVSAAILSYSSLYCARQLKKPEIAMLAIVFWAICPWISKYTIMISKDTFFADFILLWGVKLHQLLNVPSNVSNKKKSILWVILLSLMVLLFRKNGFYIVMLTFVLLLLLYKKYWKKWFCCIVVIAVFQFSYTNIVLPVLGVADGSVREMLSIPFQQTARYVQKHGEQVTSQEKDAIGAVLRYDVLADVYSAERSDPVKETFRVGTKREALATYFKVWFCMFWKHPETYVAATLSNYYGYFYPVVNDIQILYNTSVGSMRNANRDGYFQFQNLYDNIHVWLRDLCTLYDMAWMKLPIIDILMTSAFYVWLILCGIFVKFVRGDKQGFVLMFMYGVVILTALAGPCNAIDYERYIYPLILGMPVIVGMLLYEEKSTT